MDAIEQTNAAIDMLTPLVEHTSVEQLTNPTPCSKLPIGTVPARGGPAHRRRRPGGAQLGSGHGDRPALRPLRRAGERDRGLLPRRHQRRAPRTRHLRFRGRAGGGRRPRAAARGLRRAAALQIYEFRSDGDTTVVTETWADRRPGWFARVAGATMGIGDIRAHNEENIRATLFNLGIAAERPR